MAKKWTAERVIELQRLAQDVISLDTKIKINDDDSDFTLQDIIMDPGDSPLDLAIKADRNKMLEKIISACLSPREQIVIKLRYGLIADGYTTLAAVGDKFSLSRERIRQIEKRSIIKIRKYLEKHNIKSEDLL